VQDSGAGGRAQPHILECKKRAFGLAFSQLPEPKMTKQLHWILLLLFVWALAYDLAVWGAIARLPDLGDKLRVSAQRNALLATMYMAGGDVLDSAVPFLEDWGTQRARNALESGVGRMKDDPNVAMDLILSQNWNSTHAFLKLMYWAAPVLGVAFLLDWARRPKKVSLMGRH
jgi:hypothetical protein